MRSHCFRYSLNQDTVVFDAPARHSDVGTISNFEGNIRRYSTSKVVGQDRGYRIAGVKQKH